MLLSVRVNYIVYIRSLSGTTKKPASWLLFLSNGWFVCDITQNLRVNCTTSISFNCKRTINHLAKLVKWLSCVVSTYQYGAFSCMLVTCCIGISGCGFTVKRVCDMMRTYSQMHHIDKYSQHSSIISPVWLNGWVLVYKLNSCGFKSHCSHLDFRYHASSKEFLDIEATIECKFTLKYECDMIRIYSRCTAT